MTPAAQAPASNATWRPAPDGPTDVLAFIPARGGSQRLPRKNLRLLAGRPLVEHAVALARSVPRIGRCVVSTDDADIAAVALAAGAEVIRRPAALAGDTASTASAARHAMQELGWNGACPSILVTLQPNCPLRTPALVERALTLFLAHRPDTVVSVSPVSTKSGTLANGVFHPQYTPGARSQDLQATVIENGLVYVTDIATLLATGDMFTPRLRGLLCDPIAALGDIDTEADLLRVERLLQLVEAPAPAVDSELEVRR
jgi:CMP-N-acetylneuraminic acid synthetase